MVRRVFTAIAIFMAISIYCEAQDYASIVSEYFKKHNFNGVVGITSAGKIQYLDGMGIADRRFNNKINDQTKFKICSITKTFTTVIALQLMEEGKLRLDASIGTYLPEYTGEGQDKVNIHHLLTYSSGIPNCEGNLGMGVYQREITTDGFIKSYCSGKLEFEPGSRFNYDNGAFIMLGRIIEKLSGKPFSEILFERILKPLAMKNTSYAADSMVIENLASSYWQEDSTSQFYNDPPYYYQNYGPSAAIYSTVHDLLLFDQALFSGKLLKPSTLELMLTPYPELYGVAYGFWVYDLEIGDKKYRAADRQGSIWGSNATWLHLIDRDVAIIVLSNTNATDIHQMRMDLAKLAVANPSKK